MDLTIDVNVSEHKILESLCPRCRDSLAIFMVENVRMILCLDSQCNFSLQVHEGGTSK